MKPTPRQYFWRPDLTNRIDEELAAPDSLDLAGLRRTLIPRATGAASISTRRPRRSRVHRPVIHLRFQDPASWLTPSGVAKKRKMLEAKGLPDFKGRRFITLTIDPKLFGHCPLTAYLAGKDHLRRFLEAGRLAGLWDRGAWWAWKLEFQRNGWPHWHLILDRTAKFSLAEMRKISDIWGYGGDGGTNCRRISKSRFGYQFKYAFKGVFQEDSDGSGLCVPQWFLDYYRASKDGKKPKSFGRARFWQTSKGFYTGKPAPVKDSGPSVSSLVPRPVSAVLTDRNRAVMVISRRRDGRYISSRRLHLSVDYEYFVRVHLWDADNGAGCTLSARSFAMDPETVKHKLIEKNESWKLQLLAEENRLTYRKAMSYRRDHKNLETY